MLEAGLPEFFTVCLHLMTVSIATAGRGGSCHCHQVCAYIRDQKCYCKSDIEDKPFFSAVLNKTVHTYLDNENQVSFLLPILGTGNFSLTVRTPRICYFPLPELNKDVEGRKEFGRWQETAHCWILSSPSFKCLSVT